MGMTAHNLRRRKLAEVQAKERAASLKAAPPRNLAAELEVERARSAHLAAELAAEKTAKAELEEELTAPAPEASSPKATERAAPPAEPRQQPQPQQQRLPGRGGRG